MRLAVIGIIAGLSGFFFIVLVNRTIQLMVSGTLGGQIGKLFISFLVVVCLFFLSRRLLSIGIIKLSQDLFWNIRKEIIKLVLNSDFRNIEQSRNEIYSILTTDVGVLTNASLLIIELITSCILIISCFAYMLFISPVLFAISIIIIVLGVIIYQFSSRKHNQLFERARDLEKAFLKYFNAILSGSKEIIIESEKGKDIYNKKLLQVSEESNLINKKALTGFLNNQITGQVLFYSLVSFIVLCAGSSFSINNGIVISFTFVLLYVLGPIENIMVILPSMSRALVAAKRLINLRSTVKGYDSVKGGENKIVPYLFNREIKIEQLEYHFRESMDGFKVGPVNLEILKGEIVFIYGGNGSGKTTFLYSLISLLDLTHGSITVDGKAVQDSDKISYRKLFAPVFSDFYLFDEFYGIQDPNKALFGEYLKMFELEDKVKILDNSFSTTLLSTGQRKRLALISALMEAKPVLIMDEWAADQDPYFRKKFYTQILPVLKSKGITIIAITHDDQYYYCADKLYKMEFGMLSRQQVKDIKINDGVYNEYGQVL